MPSLPSHLQAAWTHLFKERRLVLLLAGSHIGMMVARMSYNAPLLTRFTAQLPVRPLAFPALADFLPHYTTTDVQGAKAVRRHGRGRLAGASCH